MGAPVMEAPSLFGDEDEDEAVNPVQFDYSMLPNKTANLSGGGKVEYF